MDIKLVFCIVVCFLVQMVTQAKVLQRLSKSLTKSYFQAGKAVITSQPAQIRILLSAALTDAHYEFRKQQYVESFRKIASYGYKDLYVVEAIKKQGPTFLDDFSKNVFYASTNDTSFKNNGINEARTLLEGSYYFNFAPDDMILKMTGRYLLLSDYFVKCVQNNIDYDAFFKINQSGYLLTLCFAMKCKYFKEMFEQMDFLAMEKQWINLETEVTNYVQRKISQGNFKVFFVDKLDVEANLFGSSTCQSSEILIF